MNLAAITIDVQVSLWYIYLESFEYVLRNQVAAFYDSSVFRILFIIIITDLRVLNKLAKYSI